MLKSVLMCRWLTSIDESVWFANLLICHNTCYQDNLLCSHRVSLYVIKHKKCKLNLSPSFQLKIVVF